MEEKKSKKLGLVITDGVGYRNFILSDFIKEASGRFYQIVIYSALPKEVYSLEGFNNIYVKELPVFTEPFLTWFYRKTKEVAHLRLHNDFFGINDNHKANQPVGRTNRAVATKFIYKVTEKFHSEGFIKNIEKRQINSVAKHSVSEACIMFLKEDNPDLLFFTHQRPPYIIPLIYAARKLNIRTCSFIFSWDNLSSKGRMAANFNSFLVWSALMKKDMNYFYPLTKTQKVEVVGTPQFEPYIMPESELDVESFYQRFELDDKKKTICYSCGDISTSRKDGLYIEVIARAMEEEKFNKNINFIVRTSPAEEPKRFETLRRKFPFIKWNFPKWSLSRSDHPEAWSQRVPFREDIKDLRMILQYSDIGINMCSTMSLDFMLFDKPVINPVFGNENNGLYNDQRFLEFDHYKNLVIGGAVAIARNEEELIKEINFSLNNPEARIIEQRRMISLQIGKPLEGTSKRIADVLMNLDVS